MRSEKDLPLGTDRRALRLGAFVVMVVVATVAASNVAARPTGTSVPGAAPEKLRIHAALLIATKQMESGWQPSGNPLEYGAFMSFGMKDWPVDIALDVYESETGGCWFVCLTTSATGKTLEFDTGVRKYWRTRHVLPYVEGGLSVFSAKFEDLGVYPGVSSTDIAPGVWAGGGVLFRFGLGFEFGVDVRYTTAHVELDYGYGAQHLSTAGFQYGALLGVGF